MKRPTFLFAIMLACVGCPPEQPPSTNPDPTSATLDPTTSATTDPNPALAKQGEKCDDGATCDEGLTCVKYFGIAGPSGPEFTSCEIPCPDEKSACPDGQQCITIADGPGRVCRPPQP